jgi:hypothetical protein
MFTARAISAILSASLALAAESSPQAARPLPHISANSLRGHVSFLSSDLLQGRDTPSPGLDIAGEYIASQFRRSGLEPAGDDGYFQTVRLVSSRSSLEAFDLVLEEGGNAVRVPGEAVSVQNSSEISLTAVKVFKVVLDSDAPLELTEEQVNGKVLLAGSREMNTSTALSLLRDATAKLRPAAFLVITDPPLPGGARLCVDRADFQLPGFPVAVQARSDALMRIYGALKPGDTEATVSLHISAPREESVTVRNVVGLLRGSDPTLKDEYLLVTAHYDHLGVNVNGSGDRINNGANDNASGTAAVIELASIFSATKSRPKRSILFLAFCGEEEGMLGSWHYTRHPVVPLRNTVADINLEGLGRTDDTEGPQISKLSLTGYGYSDVTRTFQIAGRLTGVSISLPEKTDLFFNRSDNFPFARSGIPAHTVSVGYMYPDYHRPGDEWQKLDYQNMAKITRTVAFAVQIVADSPNAPKWNQANPKAARFIKAAHKGR